jgi:glycosyltransferase involved in cell wall biosynthesis
MAFLSGAARVSTRSGAEALGPRAHVVGFLQGMREIGWDIEPFILGDLLPAWVSGRSSERAIRGGGLRTHLADLLRVGLRPVLPLAARLKFDGRVDWTYERLSILQHLGEALQRRGVPWILETNAILFSEASRDRLTTAMLAAARATEVQAYRKCDALVCMTQALADLVLREARIDARKIVVVPSAVDTELFRPTARPPVRLFEGPTIGFLGALNPWQSLDLLLHAVSELRKEGVPFNVAIIGDGPMRSSWQGLSRTLGEEAHVRFVGQVPPEEVPPYARGFDLGYVAQTAPAIGRTYHSPLKLYEYMAAGLPVVASSESDSREAIGNHATGYLFTPGDLPDLMRVLRLAHAQRERWREMGERARDEAARKHTWTRRAARIVAEVERILEDRFGTAYPARRRR